MKATITRQHFNLEVATILSEVADAPGHMDHRYVDSDGATEEEDRGDA